MSNFCLQYIETDHHHYGARLSTTRPKPLPLYVLASDRDRVRARLPGVMFVPKHHPLSSYCVLSHPASYNDEDSLLTLDRQARDGWLCSGALLHPHSPVIVFFSKRALFLPVGPAELYVSAPCCLFRVRFSHGVRATARPRSVCAQMLFYINKYSARACRGSLHSCSPQHTDGAPFFAEPLHTHSGVGAQK